LLGLTCSPPNGSPGTGCSAAPLKFDYFRLIRLPEKKITKHEQSVDAEVRAAALEVRLKQEFAQTNQNEPRGRNFCFWI